MALRKEPLTFGEFYHIYNRGNSKQNIFLDDADRERFVKLLYLCNSSQHIRFREDIINRKIDAWDYDKGKPIVSIGAWVLMKNHFHIYLTPRRLLGGNEKVKESSISVFVRKLGTAYSMYFNKKYQRTGKLFEGHFKSVRTESDPQAKYVFSYIHLNPLKIIDARWKERGLKNIKKGLAFLNQYRWSSYHDYRGIIRDENKILQQDNFPDYFSNKKIFDREIFDWLSFPKEPPW